MSTLDARRVAERLAVLPAREMRAARLLEVITKATADDAAWLLDTLATAGRAGGPPFDVSLLAAVDVAGSAALSYGLRRSIFEAAHRCGLAACMELLRTEDSAQTPGAQKPRPLVPGSRPLTLGERKSLARSCERAVLERMLLDPHADVVRLLLVNPRVTEQDILRIATSRRSSAVVLGLVLDAPRWGIRAGIRYALVRNPNLPVATALRLLGLLNRAEQEDLLRDPSLPQEVHTALRRRLRPSQ